MAKTSFSERAKVQERHTRKMRSVTPIRDGRLIEPNRNMNGIRVFTPPSLIVRRIKRCYVSYSVLDDLNNGDDLLPKKPQQRSSLRHIINLVLWRVVVLRTSIFDNLGGWFHTTKIDRLGQVRVSDSNTQKKFELVPVGCNTLNKSSQRCCSISWTKILPVLQHVKRDNLKTDKIASPFVTVTTAKQSN